ncbi:MAG: hypothetical protein IIX60_01130 [Clostridia bacterium]|nr:hypothetical protein [Clostridia bacterium]
MKNSKNVHNPIYQVIKSNSKYGIKGSCDNKTISIENLTENLDKITDFVNMLNNESLELCHLKEVTEDFLYFELKITK